MSTPNYSPSGFWRIIADGHLEQHLKKPFFKKPQMAMAHCINLWTSAFEIGGIIGTRYARNEDPLVSCFLGMSGPVGSAHTAVAGMVEMMPDCSVLSSMEIFEYVAKQVIKSMGRDNEGLMDFLISQKDRGVTEEVILSFTWEFASLGLSLGISQPEVFRIMFDLTYAPVDKEKWSFAHASGLAIPSAQHDHSYSTQEKLWDMIFLEFAQRYNKQHYNTLVG